MTGSKGALFRDVVPPSVNHPALAKGYPATRGRVVRSTRTRFTDCASTALDDRAAVVTVHVPLARRMEQV